MGRDRRIISSSMEETIELGEEIGKKQENSLICLYGDLGGGKTTLIKGIVKAKGGDIESVCSPTFAYLNIYTMPSSFSIYHFDLYRLVHVEQFLSVGFDEYFFLPGIKCVEWSEKITSHLPEKRLEIHFVHVNQHMREITIVEKN